MTDRTEGLLSFLQQKVSASSQRRLAEDIKVSRQLLRSWIKTTDAGPALKRLPDVEHLEMIARAFGLSLDDFLVLIEGDPEQVRKLERKNLATHVMQDETRTPEPYMQARKAQVVTALLRGDRDRAEWVGPDGKSTLHCTVPETGGQCIQIYVDGELTGQEKISYHYDGSPHLEPDGEVSRAPADKGPME